MNYCRLVNFYKRQQLSLDRGSSKTSFQIWNKAYYLVAIFAVTLRRVKSAPRQCPSNLRQIPNGESEFREKWSRYSARGMARNVSACHPRTLINLWPRSGYLRRACAGLPCFLIFLDNLAFSTFFQTTCNKFPV